MSWLCRGPLGWLQRRLGWSWVVLLVRRGDDDVATLELPGDLPVSIRHNTDDTVSIAIGNDNPGDALLGELRARVG